MISEAVINWEALRTVLNGDFKIYARLAAAADHGAEGNAQRERYAAMMEQVNKTLRSMDAIESASVPSVPGLAEHTAAAPDSDTQPDPYIDPIAAEHVSEYEHGAMATQCRCGHPRWVHYRDGSEQGGGCDATQIGDAPVRCRCKGFDEISAALAEATAAACDTITKAAQ